MRTRRTKKEVDVLKLQILEEYKETQILNDIARKLDISIGAMSFYARSLHLKGSGPKNLLTPELKQRILNEYRNTQNLMEIARRIGVTKGQMDRYAKVLKIKGIRSDNIIWVDDESVQCSKCSKILLFSELEIIRPHSTNPSRISYCRKCRTNQAIKNNKSSLDRYLGNRIRSIKTRANTTELPFDLTATFLKQLYESQRGRCFYTDVELVIPQHGDTASTKSGHRLSVDKVIPHLGYIKGNVILCTVRANHIKGDMTLEEMKVWLPSWLQRLHEFFKL